MEGDDGAAAVVAATGSVMNQAEDGVSPAAWPARRSRLRLLHLVKSRVTVRGPRRDRPAGRQVTLFAATPALANAVLMATVCLEMCGTQRTASTDAALR